MSDSNSEQPKRRPRSATSIALGWIAEKLRRSERIKEQLKSGAYSVDSTKIAEAILNKK
jgi:anti-sigma28 factor (negative regulator of flagellin synthesis)